MNDETTAEKNETWEDRLGHEYAQLLERLQKLRRFQDTDKHTYLPETDIFLLSLQQVSMESYLSVLNQRINRL